MPDYLVVPRALRIEGLVDVSSSKSATNRALVLASLSAEEIEIARPLQCEDTDALARCLQAMGARIHGSAAALVIRGPLGRDPGEQVRLEAEESGTAARLLAALASVTPGQFLLTGSARLRERPMRELLDALLCLGASIEFRQRDGYLPVVIRGRALSGRARVDASRSSQFLSALLLAAIAAPGVEIEVTGPMASAPYVRLTIEMMRAFGHVVEESPFWRVTRGTQAIARYRVPGDYSSAIPLLAAAGIVGGRVGLRGLAWPAPDADAQALPALESMGLSIRTEPDVVTAARTGDLKPLRTRATDFPDAVAALAALAAFAPGESRFEGIGHLRFKESDRIETLRQLLTTAGARVETGNDALIVHGPIPRGEAPARRLPTANDHRIVMAAALLGLGLPGILIENPACVAKSYPLFFHDLEQIVVRQPA